MSLKKPYSNKTLNYEDKLKEGLMQRENELRAWQTVSKETILNHSKFLIVENHTVKLPDGRIIRDWPWLIIPSAVIVLALTDDDKFLCFRQIKYAIEGSSLAPVGGMIEPNEQPIEAAKRELLEEMGCEASEWISLGSHILDPNRGIATMHLFLALHARIISEPNSDDLEDQQLLLLSRQEITKALNDGAFKILSWSAVVAMSLNYLHARNYFSNLPGE